MGNRALIVTRACDMGIYLHWNGGRDSVSAFLKYCELQGYRWPEEDNYGWARLCQVIANFFDGCMCVGIFPLEGGPAKVSEYSPGDNGIYVIEKWQIVDRIDAPEEEQDVWTMRGMLKMIDESQPVKQRLSEDAWEKVRKEIPPVTKWVIYDEDGEIAIQTLFSTEQKAENYLEYLRDMNPTPWKNCHVEEELDEEI